MLLVVRRLHELGRDGKIPLYIFSIDLQRRSTTLSTESCCAKYLRAFGVPANMLAVFRHLHNGMRAYVRTDDDEHSGRFDVTQGLP